MDGSTRNQRKLDYVSLVHRAIGVIRKLEEAGAIAGDRVILCYTDVSRVYF